MKIPPLAAELNATLETEAPAALSMLSELGKRYYFPKGILSQTAEAKVKARRFNATIGIATERGGPMFLPSVQKHFHGLDPRDLYPYAPAGGKPELREAWREKQLRENPAMRGKVIGEPIVTAALTHGLALVSELFVDPGDKVLLPDKFWGNYRLTFSVRQGGELVTFPFFDGERFNRKAFRESLKRLAAAERKLVVILNFPNNPTGFTPTRSDAEDMVEAMLRAAEGGLRQVVACDDAYFGLFYEDEALAESLFGMLAGLHPNVLPIKLDGATKEEFVWGFRVGFLTYAARGPGSSEAANGVLEKKTVGAIRAGVSNCPHPSQSIVLRALKDPAFSSEQAEKRATLKARARRVHEVLSQARFRDAWTPYPFNSGYFMCLGVNGVDAEELRVHLLERYGVGVIANDATDIRVAFSCLELDQIEEVFDTIYRAWKDLSQGGR